LASTPTPARTPATATESAAPSATPHFGLRPNGEASWLPQQLIAIPVVVTGPAVTNSVSISAIWKPANGGRRSANVQGTSGQYQGFTVLLTNVTETILTLTIAQNPCCSGLPIGSYVVYGICTGCVSPQYSIEYPGPDPSNNPPPCVRLDKDRVVNIAPDNPDRVNCPGF
jgi:hypothetical protein